jgi:hypothetical protein
MDFDAGLPQSLPVGRLESPLHMKLHAIRVPETLAIAERGPLPEVLVEDDVNVWALWDDSVQEWENECLSQPLTNWWGAASSAPRRE